MKTKIRIIVIMFSALLSALLWMNLGLTAELEMDQEGLDQQLEPIYDQPMSSVEPIVDELTTDSLADQHTTEISQAEQDLLEELNQVKWDELSPEEAKALDEKFQKRFQKIIGADDDFDYSDWQSSDQPAPRQQGLKRSPLQDPQAIQPAEGEFTGQQVLPLELEDQMTQDTATLEEQAPPGGFAPDPSESEEKETQKMPIPPGGPAPSGRIPPPGESMAPMTPPDPEFQP